MKIKAGSVTEGARLIGWVLVIFSLTRTYAIADVFNNWREESERYYVQDRRRLLHAEYGQDDAVRDSTTFAQASNLMVMGSVMRLYGDDGNIRVTGPCFCIGIVMLMISGQAGSKGDPGVLLCTAYLSTTTV